MVYIDIKLGKRGEIVIPAFIRKKYKLTSGRKIKFDMKDDKLELVVTDDKVIQRLRDIAKKEGIRADKIVYGDKIYEEEFK